jgi:molecular chaperone GrpE
MSESEKARNLEQDLESPQDPAHFQSQAKTQPRAQSKAYVDPSLLQDEETDKASAELAETKDKLLRALAELENLRRRTERDIKDASSYAITKFANDVLAIADNLRRALEASPPEIKTDKIAAPLLEGVEITERALLQTLERYGVKPIEAMGTKFDPHLHQAMFEIEKEGVEPGIVVQVMQPGYTIHDRTLRPAMVGVSKAKSTS